MNRSIELTLAAAGAAGGFMFGGIQGAAIGAVGGGAIGAMGVNSLRSGGKTPSIYIKYEIKKELESILHIAIATSWALRPHIESDQNIQRQIVEKIFKNIVENYTSTITPYVQEMNLHLARVVMTGIKPEESLSYVRRRYSPGFMRKNDSVSFMISKHILVIMEEFGPFEEAKAWYFRWCQEIGIKKYAQATWLEHFGEREIPDYRQWNKTRKHDAAASYFEDDITE